VRIALGILLVLCGFVGFLPILGFWMVPFGLLILSVDVPAVRRFRRRTEVKWGRWRQRRRAEKAAKAADSRDVGEA
jgi:purine-cytosine permease-like protein